MDHHSRECDSQMETNTTGAAAPIGDLGLDHEKKYVSVCRILRRHSSHDISAEGFHDDDRRW